MWNITALAESDLFLFYGDMCMLQVKAGHAGY